MRSMIMSVLVLFAAFSAPAQSHFGDVSIRSTADRVIVMLDTSVDASAPTDGVIDQMFVLQTREPLAVPIAVELPRALVVQSATSLRVTTADQRYEFSLDDAVSSTGTRVIGIAHSVGGDVIHLAGEGECVAGGPGATACKVATRAGRCDVVCANGFYACGSVRNESAGCRCVMTE